MKKIKKRYVLLLGFTLCFLCTGCGEKNTVQDKGELVRIETVGESGSFYFTYHLKNGKIMRGCKQIRKQKRQGELYGRKQER